MLLDHQTGMRIIGVSVVMDGLTGLMKALVIPDVTDELKQTVVDGVLAEAGDRTLNQLAQDEADIKSRQAILRPTVANPGKQESHGSR